MLQPGQHCVYTDYGAFSEYHTVDKVFPLPEPSPEAIPLLVSGLTAAIALKVLIQARNKHTPPKPSSYIFLGYQSKHISKSHFT